MMDKFFSHVVPKTVNDRAAQILEGVNALVKAERTEQVYQQGDSRVMLNVYFPDDNAPCGLDCTPEFLMDFDLSKGLQFCQAFAQHIEVQRQRPPAARQRVFRMDSDMQYLGDWNPGRMIWGKPD